MQVRMMAGPAAGPTRLAGLGFPPYIRITSASETVPQ